jgi:hypothetical protein
VRAVRRGASQHRDPAVAARELSEQIKAPDTALAVVFCSAHYDLTLLGPELAKRFEGVELIGCTTAGEIALDGYRVHSLVGLSLPRDDYLAVCEHLANLGTTSLLRVCDLVQSLRRKLQLRAPEATARNTFALLFIDGLSGIEEPVLSAIGRELGDIPLVGGSAGDDLQFRETAVLHDGSFHAGSAVLALVHASVPFEVFKTQHVVSSDTKMVITEADPVRRIVTEINAEPASAEYARQFGVVDRHLLPMVLATHPLVVRVGGDDYARSIRRVNEDGSLTFYCAIDEGIVLSAAVGTDIVADLERVFAAIVAKIGEPDAILGFDCIFRRLELEERRLDRPVSRLLANNRVVGFSTYGEQFNAMHLNQTFTGVAFGSAAQRP